MKSLVKIFLIIAGAALLAFIIFLLYASIKDYKPLPEEVVYETENPDTLLDSTVLNTFIWNIGYCGLGEDMDFFYDRGEKVITSENNFQDNLHFISKFIRNNDSVDIFLLQEVDIHSKRSYRSDQFDSIAKQLMDHHAVFAKNYQSFFVPTPLSQPMGEVKSGLAVYSKQKPAVSVRHSFPGNYAWPKSLFMLDRCFLVNRYPLNNGKELLVINTHNSAYDDGSLREMQMNHLKEFLTNEYKKGNKIITGGDWNQCPPGFMPDFAYFHFDTINVSYIPKNYLTPEWSWVYNNHIPTNRRLNIPYDKEKSLTTVIDYFLLSPGMKIIEIKTIDLDFQYSDHQPVIVKVKLE